MKNGEGEGIGIRKELEGKKGLFEWRKTKKMERKSGGGGWELFVWGTTVQ
jgi:hypothetical protein